MKSRLFISFHPKLCRNYFLFNIYNILIKIMAKFNLKHNFYIIQCMKRTNFYGKSSKYEEFRIEKKNFLASNLNIVSITL